MGKSQPLEGEGLPFVVEEITAQGKGEEV